MRHVVATRARSRAFRRVKGVLALILVGVLAGGLVSFWPDAQAATNGTYRDQFTNKVYTGSDGSIAWSTPWVEIGDGDGPGGGEVKVADGHCTVNPCVEIDQHDKDYVIGMYRVADLSGSAAAQLTYDFQRRKDGSNTGMVYSVQVASSASGPWTTLVSYPITTTDSGPQSAAFDITGSIGSTTTIRFVSNAASTNDELYVDNVQIQAWATVFNQDLGDRTDSEGASVSFSSAGTHPAGYTLTYSAAALPGGVSIDPSTGLISGTISQTAASGSPHAVIVTATDSQNNQYQDKFAWTVTAVNVAPSVTQPTDRSGAEGDSVSVTMSGSDPDADSLTWSATGLPGGLSIDASTGTISGSLSYTASSGSPHSVTVRATDPGGLYGEKTFVWTVSNTNRPPQVTNPGDQTNGEGDTVSLTVGGSDPDGESLTWSASGLPSGLSIGSSTGVVAGVLPYTASTSSPFAVTVTATDPGGATHSASFSWTITDVNRKPTVVNPGDRSTPEGTTVTFAMGGSDPDGDSLTWSASGLPLGLSIDGASGVISGTVSYDAGASSPFAVTVRATDPGGLYDEASFAWTATETNRAPSVTNPGSQSSSEGSPASLQVQGSDPDGDSLTWTATGLPSGLAIDPATGNITGTPSYTSSGTHTVTVRATDPGSLFHEVSFAWAVANTNRPPVVSNPGNRTSAEGASVAFAMSGSDPDGQSLTWSATGLPTGLSIGASSGIITGTVSYEAGATSPFTVAVRATDPDGLFHAVSFSWIVTETNRPPVATYPGPQTSSEGEFDSFQMQGSDPDGGTLSWSATGLPAGMTIAGASGVISGTPSYVSSGTYSVTVTVADPQGATGTTTFSWVVANTNRAPVVLNPGARSTAEAAPATFAISGSDPDGDSLGWTAVGLPEDIAIDPDSGVVSGTPGYEASGTYAVTVTATDTEGLATSVSFSWVVGNTNRAPLITSPAPQQAIKGVPVEIDFSANDPDGDAVLWEAAGLPGGLFMGPTTGVLSGAPSNAGFFVVSVTASDPEGDLDIFVFSWHVISTDDFPPIPGDDRFEIAVDQIDPEGHMIDVLANDRDPEGRSLHLASVGPAEVGEVELVDGQLVYRPASGWLGSTLVSYQVADPAGNQATGTLQVVVQNSWDVRLGTVGLATNQRRAPLTPDATNALSPSGVQVLLSSVVQSLYVLRVPLVLLGGAVVWSLLLGGVLNLGFVFSGGLPRLVRRSSRNVAVVMVHHGGKLEVREAPGAGVVVDRLTAVARGVVATGRREEDAGGDEWVEIETGSGTGWVPVFHLTEAVDRSGFADDPMPMDMVRLLVERMRSRQDFSELVSRHGLFVAHHAPLVHFPHATLPRVMDDPTPHSWKGRNPASPDFAATFDLAVATGVLDAWDHLRRELLHDETALPSTVIPVEFTNLHFISIGADVHGPERLAQSAWLVVFTYEETEPRIIGLVREG